MTEWEWLTMPDFTPVCIGPLGCAGCFDRTRKPRHLLAGERYQIRNGKVYCEACIASNPAVGGLMGVLTDANERRTPCADDRHAAGG